MLPFRPGLALPTCCPTPFLSCSHPSPWTTGAGSFHNAGMKMARACSGPAVGIGTWARDWTRGRRLAGISASFGAAPPGEVGGVWPEGNTTAVISGVGVGVGPASASATSRLSVRSTPMPLNRTNARPRTAPTSISSSAWFIVLRPRLAAGCSWAFVSSEWSEGEPHLRQDRRRDRIRADRDRTPALAELLKARLTALQALARQQRFQFLDREVFRRTPVLGHSAACDARGPRCTFDARRCARIIPERVQPARSSAFLL